MNGWIVVFAKREGGFDFVAWSPIWGGLIGVSDVMYYMSREQADAFTESLAPYVTLHQQSQETRIPDQNRCRLGLKVTDVEEAY